MESPPATSSETASYDERRGTALRILATLLLLIGPVVVAWALFAVGDVALSQPIIRKYADQFSKITTTTIAINEFCRDYWLLLVVPYMLAYVAISLAIWARITPRLAMALVTIWLGLSGILAVSLKFGALVAVRELSGF